jgi:hypothetical protein
MKDLFPANDQQGGYLDDKGRRYFPGDKPNEWHVWPNEKTDEPLWTEWHLGWALSNPTGT